MSRFGWHVIYEAGQDFGSLKVVTMVTRCVAVRRVQVARHLTCLTALGAADFARNTLTLAVTIYVCIYSVNFGAEICVCHYRTGSGQHGIDREAGFLEKLRKAQRRTMAHC